MLPVTQRKRSPIHDFWHPRIEGQIRDAMFSHPEWFNVTSKADARTLVNSLAKRIVGEIAAVASVAAKRAEVADICPSTSGSGGGSLLPPGGGGVGTNCTPPEPRNALLTNAKLTIRDGRIHYRLYRQDGSIQPMDCADTPSNRLTVSWFQAHDRYTPSGID